MIRRLTTLRNNPIFITNSAWKKIKKISKNYKENNGFLLSCSSGGCGGFNFEFKFLDTITKNKILKNKIKPIMLENEGTKVTIDPIAEMLILGTTIDYQSENYNNGIFESKFLFKVDSNLATSCGCNKSFSLK